MPVSIDLSGGGSVIVFETPSTIGFQRYDANHSPIGSAVTVTTSTAAWFTVAPSGSGFSVTWDTSASATPLAQDYDASGAPVGSVHNATTSPLASIAFTSRQNVVSSSSSSAFLPDEGYAVARVDRPQGGPVTVHVQRYDVAANAVGPEFVQSVGIDLISEVTVTPTTGGGYVVSYIDTFNFSASLVVQRFAADGTFLGTANPAQYGGISVAISGQSVAGLPDGGFIASWIGTFNQSAQVYAWEFSATGAPIGSVQMLGVPVSSSPSNAPQIDVFPDGRYVINWTSANGAQHNAFTEASSTIAPHDNGHIDTPATSYTMPVGPHDVTLIAAAPQSVTGNADDNVMVANDYSSTLDGAGGNDTLIAGHNSVILTGGSGADTFAYPYLPWNAGHITDFTVGTDKLDLHTLFQASGYSGSDPIADGYMQLASDGSGGTLVLFDSDGPGTGASWTLLTTLDHVSPSGLTAAALLGQGGQPQHRIASDFDGDLKSDVLWQSDSGQAVIWLMNGTSQAGGGGAGSNPGPAWHVKAAADFDGDGKADILWQNTDGTPVIWFMNGATLISGGVAGFNPGSAWHIVGAGDFNADGHADILWQNSDGTPAIWLMNGTNVIGGASLTNPGSSWHVIGAADFNGDGKADILWQSDSGQAAVWLMNGTSFVSGSGVGPNPGTAWHIKGAGDFDGDGKSDILWQNSDGTTVIWFMNGTNLLSGAVAGGFNPGSTWHALGAGDFNGDSHADILWQNDNGTPAIWLMNGSTLLSGAALSNPGSSWHPLAMTS